MFCFVSSITHKSKKVIIHTEILSSDKDENEHDEPKLQSVNKSANDQTQDIYIIHDLAQWLKPTFCNTHLAFELIKVTPTIFLSKLYVRLPIHSGE
ncbi:unnamed protein product [Rotaria magnacalcarata]